MKPNELMRHLRKLLALNEKGMTEILALGQYAAAPEQMRNWLRHENEAQYEPCPPLVPAHFLEGLIIAQRGPREGGATPPIGPLTNNQVLKKLRIAFNLQGDEMHTLFASVDHPLSKQEMDALFRKPEHKNFQVCSEHTLRLFLQALTERYRPRRPEMAS